MISLVHLIVSFLAAVGFLTIIYLLAYWGMKS